MNKEKLKAEIIEEHLPFIDIVENTECKTLRINCNKLSHLYFINVYKKHKDEK